MRVRTQTILAVHVLLVTGCVSVEVKRHARAGEETFELSKEQAAEVFTALKELQPEVNAIESGDSIVIPCPKGGNVKAVGEADQDEIGTSAVVTIDATSTPRGCVVATKAGDEFTITGDPSFRDLLELTIRSMPPKVDAATGFIRGNFKWRFGEHQGSCAVALDLVGRSPTGTAGLRLEYQGRLCGFDDVELGFTVPFG